MVLVVVGVISVGRKNSFKICPQCKAVVDGAVDVCPHCGASIEALSEDVVSDWLKYLGVDEEVDTFAKRFLIKEDKRLTQFKKRIEYIENFFERAKEIEGELGTLKAREILDRAKVALMEKRYEEVEKLLEECRERINAASTQYRVLQDTLKMTKKKIKEADEYGGDLKDANKLLQQALEAMERMEYDKAISFAIRSGLSAEKAKTKYESWRVEISDWLE